MEMSISKQLTSLWSPTILNSPGTVPGYGGAAPPAPAPESISVVIEWITQPPLMDTYRAECTGNRWLNVARWFPLTAIFHWFTSANTSKSNCWPYAIGQPPQRSSAPQTRFWSVFRTITDSFGRMLRWNTTSSRGFRAAPVWMFIWHLCGETERKEVLFSWLTQIRYHRQVQKLRLIQQR